MFRRIVDVHIHPFALLSEDQLLAELNNAEVELGVLLALDVDPMDLDSPQTKEMISNRLLEMYFWDAKKVMEELRTFLEVARTENDAVASLVKKYPGRFVGFGSIDLSKSQAYVEGKIKEIDRLNLRGIKLIPTLQFFNPVESREKIEKVFEFCKKKGKIVTYHTGCDPYVWEDPHFSQDANPKHLKPIVEDFEEVKVVVAHMGCYSSRMPGIWMDEALELGKNHENVWFDIAAVIYVVTREKFVHKIRETVGMDRVLFGSDYPAVQGVTIEMMIDDVKKSPHLTEIEKEKVLGLNAIELLGL